MLVLLKLLYIIDTYTGENTMFHSTIKPIILKTENRESSKDYRIKGGEIQCQFYGKWWDIEETNEKATDRMKEWTNECGGAQKGYCKISNWDQHERY